LQQVAKENNNDNNNKNKPVQRPSGIGASCPG
jgi:hypothetical protein